MNYCIRKVMDQEDDERYEYIRAVVEMGELTWDYKLIGGKPTSQTHDEDVTLWSEQDIADLTIKMLDVPKEDQYLIEVIHA